MSLNWTLKTAIQAIPSVTKQSSNPTPYIVVSGRSAQNIAQTRELSLQCRLKLPVLVFYLPTHGFETSIKDQCFGFSIPLEAELEECNSRFAKLASLRLAVRAAMASSGHIEFYGGNALWKQTIVAFALDNRVRARSTMSSIAQTHVAVRNVACSPEKICYGVVQLGKRGCGSSAAKEATIKHACQLDSRVPADRHGFHSPAALAGCSKLCLVEFSVPTAISILFGDPVHRLGQHGCRSLSRSEWAAGRAGWSIGENEVAMASDLGQKIDKSSSLRGACTWWTVSSRASRRSWLPSPQTIIGIAKFGGVLG